MLNLMDQRTFRNALKIFIQVNRIIASLEISKFSGLHRFKYKAYALQRRVTLKQFVMLQIIAQQILVIPYGIAVFVGQLFPFRIFFRRKTEVFRSRIRLILQIFKPSEIRVFSQLMQAEFIIVHAAVINFIDPVSLCVSNNAERFPDGVLVHTFLLHLNSFRKRFVVILAAECVLRPSILHRTNRTRRLFIASLQFEELLLLFCSAQPNYRVSDPLANPLEKRYIGLCQTLNAGVILKQPLFAECRRQFAVCRLCVKRNTLFCIHPSDIIAQYIRRNALFLREQMQRHLLQCVIAAAVLQMVR